jgi:hypothetical protein
MSIRIIVNWTVILASWAVNDSSNTLLYIRREAQPAELMFAPRTYSETTISASRTQKDEDLTRHVIASKTLFNTPLASRTLLRRIRD